VILKLLKSMATALASGRFGAIWIVIAVISLPIDLFFRWLNGVSLAGAVNLGIAVTRSLLDSTILAALWTGYFTAVVKLLAVKNELVRGNLR